ncbi:MAG TPA: hypothetical protein VHU17_14575 [Acidimicrobiales bacterium]|nr:hypothetical protein [Acidimicrobiales bacterium]
MAKKPMFRPVESGGNWHLNAIVERHSDYEIAIGFAEAANVIVESWIRRGPNDLLFEPLVFNHRHALELVLKAAIRESAARLRADGHLDSKVSQAALDAWLAAEAKHNLHRLAERLDELLKRLGEEKLPPETHRTLMSIHELDPTGETFRYAKVKGPGGTFQDAPRPLLSLPTDLQAHVDIEAMHVQFKSAFDLLSGGVMTVLELIAEHQCEMTQQIHD